MRRWFETIELSVSRGIATITLNRPGRLNAFNACMLDDLVAAFDATDADDEVKVVIVTGAGNRAFCSGLDLAEGADAFDLGSPEDLSTGSCRIQRDLGGQLTLRIFKSLKPVIAAVNGAAVGVGATMQLAMDIRMAATSARFAFVFARRGVTPEAASSWFLPRLVGIQNALEWCYTGRFVPAEEALTGGLVRSIHADHDLLSAAHTLAREIADNAAPVSVALTRQLMWQMMTSSHPMDAHRIDSRAVQSRGRSSDAKEGVDAFLAKRVAHFSDRVSVDMPDFFPWWSDPPFT